VALVILEIKVDIHQSRNSSSVGNLPQIHEMEDGLMTSLIEAIMEAGNAQSKTPGFPYAPADWTREAAVKMARREGLEPANDHWETVRALQEYYARHQDGALNLRELHDALEEHFHTKGGRKYLYELFPGGPVAQGCRIAGLKAPAGATDKGFGSVA
jgi:TusE/DsrC/DsvC family sulfur relay protein